MQAINITLIVDIWTSAHSRDFIGLSAYYTKRNFEKDCVVIGFKRMEGSHNSENIKSAIEAIINDYQFDKSKIGGKIMNILSLKCSFFKMIFFKLLFAMKAHR